MNFYLSFKATCWNLIVCAALVRDIPITMLQETNKSLNELRTLNYFFVNLAGFFFEKLQSIFMLIKTVYFITSITVKYTTRIIDKVTNEDIKFILL